MAERSVQDVQDAAAQVIEACGGDATTAVRALLVQNHALAQDLERCLDAVSEGYVRGRPRR